MNELDIDGKDSNFSDPSHLTIGQVTAIVAAAALTPIVAGVIAVHAYRWLTEGNGAAQVAQTIYQMLIEAPILNALLIGALGSLTALMAILLALPVAAPIVNKIKATTGQEPSAAPRPFETETLEG